MKTSWLHRQVGSVFKSVALALATMAMPAQATVIFDDGGSHDIDTPFDDVKVYDPPLGEGTWLRINEGADIRDLDGISVSVFDQAFVSIAGTLQGGLVLSDRSLTVVGFGPGEPSVRGNVEVKGRSELVLRAGAIAGNSQFKDSSKANMSGGTFQGDVECQDTCDMLVFHGMVQGAIRVQDEGEIHANGGTFQGVISAEDAATVTLKGRDFLINGLPVDYGPVSVSEGTIEGTLHGGETLSTTFAVSGDAQIVLIPEPSAMLLAAIGLFCIVLYQRRR